MSIKNKDINKKSEENQKKIEKLKKAGKYYECHHGLDGSQCIARVVPNLETFKERGDVVYASKDNAAVILVDNNPKYADEAGDFCSRISIVAGIQGRNLKEKNKVEGPEQYIDAAGIYITQQGIPQEPLGLVSPVSAGKHNKSDPNNPSRNTGKGLQYKAHSDVTAVADTIQIVGKAGGVNIYGGLPGSRLASNTPVNTFVGVNLIAGNRIDEYDVGKTLNDTENYRVPVYSLQPLVKGHSLQRFLNRLIKDAGNQASENFSKDVKSTITEITDVAALFAGFFSAGAGAVKAATLVLKVPLIITSLTKNVEKMTNTILDEVNSTEVFSESYLSRWNKTN